MVKCRGARSDSIGLSRELQARPPKEGQMTSPYRIACLLLIGSVLFLIEGCATKSGKSSGDTSRSSSSTGLKDLPGGTERVSSGELMTKADPSITNRQLAEMQA